MDLELLVRGGIGGGGFLLRDSAVIINYIYHNYSTTTRVGWGEVRGGVREKLLPQLYKWHPESRPWNSGVHFNIEKSTTS